MRAGENRFEIQLFADERWSTSVVRESEAEARAVAKQLLGNAKNRGVRVLRSRGMIDGTIADQVIFTEMRAVDPRNVQIVAVDSAPLCDSIDDLYSVDARYTLGRLLKNYLEKVYLTPTELMNDYRELRRIQNLDGLFPAAVDRISSLQARATGTDSRERRDFLYKVVEQMMTRAKEFEARYHLDAMSGDFFDSFVRVCGEAPPEERTAAALAVLSRDLRNSRSWTGKLERLIEITGKEMGDEAFVLVDGVIADIMGTTPIIQDLIGAHPNLASALCGIADLIEGKVAHVDPVSQALNSLFASDRLPQARQALIERLQRQIKSAQSLDTHGGADNERAAFRQIAGRFNGRSGMLGGPATAEALTLRYGRMLEQGGATGRRMAISGTFAALADIRARMFYLLQIAATPTGAEFLDDVVKHLHVMLNAGINRIIPPGFNVRERMTAIALLYRSVDRSTLPEDERAKLCGRIDAMLAHFLVTEKVIEKLDQTDQPLRVRADKLVRFCAAGILPASSKSLTLARTRIIDLLRQPNFDERYLEGVTEQDEKVVVLRNFHVLLAAAGFGS